MSEKLPDRAEAERYDRVRALSLAILAAIAAVASAKLAAEIVAPTVVAALFALTLAPLVRMVERVGLPPMPAAGLVVGACGIGFAGAAYLLTPSLADWRARAPSVFRTVETKLRQIERDIVANVDGATAGGPLTEKPDGTAAEKVIETGQGMATDVILATPGAIATILYAIFLCFLLLAEREQVRRAALSLAPEPATRLRISKALRDMRVSVGQYLFVILLINLGLGLCAALLFWWAGLPNPALFGAVAALLNFVPFLGPLALNLIVFAVGIVTFPTVADAVYLVLALAALNILEGQLVTPTLVGRRAEVGALSVFLAVAFGAWLWGVAGALVATPLLIVGHRFWLRMSGAPTLSPAKMRKAAG